MSSRVLLPALFLASLVSILMQLTCMWPVAILSRQLNLSAHRVFYASAAAMFFCNGLALPLITSGRTAARTRARLSVCLACCLATGSLVAGAAVLLAAGRFTRDFFHARLSAMGRVELQTVIGRYLGAAAVAQCVATPGCRLELAGHMRVLLLSAAYYNALACLLLVANACLIVRGVLLSKWLLEDEAAEAAAESTPPAALGASPPLSPELETPPSTTSEAAEEGGGGGGGGNERRLNNNSNLPVSPVWIALQ